MLKMCLHYSTDAEDKETPEGLKYFRLIWKKATLCKSLVSLGLSNSTPYKQTHLNCIC